MNLFQIDAQILACVDQDTGEIIDAEALDALQMERDRKIRNLACWIKDLKADAAALKAEAASMTARQKAAENKAESLTRYLDNFLDGQKVKTAEFAITFRDVKDDKTIIDDETKIPAEYLRTKTTTEPDKTHIKEAIRAGEAVPGAHLEDSHSISIK